MIHHLIPRVLSKLLIPFIVLFGFYVQFHGDFGPGGGFQAGVIVAAGIILYALIYGLDAAETVISPGVIGVIMALGLLLYAGVGVATMALGAEFLNYNALDSHDPVHGQHMGILIIEFGVGVTVAAVMLTIFFKFADRLKLIRDLEQMHGDDEDVR
ncbi:MAG: cation:proton antiporter [Rhizobiales bacterium NRL2]|jgi:multicomponent Na+:H+ antiporter subunit B|nr:MAG: cation:proton antiporter [Rhizobiales bacterium NRL2]